MNQEENGVSVHTGFPNPATDSTVQTLNLNQLLIWHSASTFFMRIAGRDWETQGIFDGDIAIIDRALTPKALDKIIWIHDDAFVVSGRGQAPKGAVVWGVITAIIHRYRKFQ